MATPVIMPRQGQSVESCILVEWLVAPGDNVTAGQILANIETDKAVFELESPDDGTILELFFEPGADIPVLTNIAALGKPDEDVSGLRPEGEQSVATPPVETVPEAPDTQEPPPPSTSAASAAAPAVAAPGGDATGVSPRARHRAEASGIVASDLSGTGPGGRVIERDVLAAETAAPRMSPVARELATAGAPLPTEGSGPGGMVVSADVGRQAATPAPVPAAAGEPVPLSGIRKIIAERMRTSLTTTAQLTLNRSFDATALLAYRKKVKASADSLGLADITLNDMIVYAAARTLLRHPELNAHYKDGAVTRFDRVHMGIAMDTPRGLLVPVLHEASSMSLSAISQAIKPIAAAAQKGSVNPDLLQGGTFTITNMGMLGIESFTPILNVPEVAILGVGGLTLKPVEKDGVVTHVKAITLSLTIDHQATDGAPGARFLMDLASALENFELTLAA